MNAFATAVSIGLQYGVPLEVFVRKFSYMRFDPEGITRNPEIPFAKSLPDYIMRWLASRFIADTDTLEQLGILTDDVRARKEAQQAFPIDEGNGGGNGRQRQRMARATATQHPGRRLQVRVGRAAGRVKAPDRGAHRNPAGPPGGDRGSRARPRLRPVRRDDAAHRLLLHLLELRQQHRLRLSCRASLKCPD